MNLRATQPLDNPQAPASAGSGARFAFSSGDRPLDGYTIKRGIGRGGFGEVYYALSDGGKEVALKLVCRNLEIELRGVTQCLNIKHPNLLSLYDIRQDDHDESWVVMEYVAGDSLERVIQNNPNGLPIDDVMFWMQGIAAGVGYLHHHGIIHRDLKPGNVFCDEGVVKVGDYGLSKFISCSRRSGQTGSVGTVHYMAPEVANGRYGKEIDIYALGIILYEMITGHVPFEGESLGEVLMKHLTAQPDLSQIAEPYRTAITRALAKDPDARPHTVADFMSLLPRTVHATLASAGPVPLPAPFVKDQIHAAGAIPIQPQPVNGANGHSPANAAGDAASGREIPVAQAVEGAAQSPAAEKVATPPPSPNLAEEYDPVERTVRQAWGNIAGQKRKLEPWQMAMLVIAALWIVPHFAPDRSWGSLVCTAAIVYVVYRVIWRASHRPPTRCFASMPQFPPLPKIPPVPPVPPFRPNPARYESPTWRRWKEKPQAAPLAAPVGLRQRLAELTGSMILSTLVVFVVSFVIRVYQTSDFGITTSGLIEFAWMAMSATIGAWSILIPAKIFWDGREADAALRRFAMLVVGLGVGATAFAMQNWFLVPLHYDTAAHKVAAGAVYSPGPPPGYPQYDLPQLLPHVPHSFYSLDNSPSIFAYLAFFGLLWLLPRWWRQADSSRSTRLSLWTVATTLIWAGVVNLVAPFPQPWGIIFAVTVSLAVQLASTWKPKKAQAS